MTNLEQRQKMEHFNWNVKLQQKQLETLWNRGFELTNLKFYDKM